MAYSTEAETVTFALIVSRMKYTKDPFLRGLLSVIRAITPNVVTRNTFGSGHFEIMRKIAAKRAEQEAVTLLAHDIREPNLLMSIF